MAHKVKHEDAVFRYDPDADNRAQKRNNIEGRSGKPKRADGTEQREHGARYNRRRLAETAKFDEQHGKHQQNRRREYDQVLGSTGLAPRRGPCAVSRRSK